MRTASNRRSPVSTSQTVSRLNSDPGTGLPGRHKRCEVTPLLVHHDVRPAADLIIVDERIELPPLAGRQVDEVNRADGVDHGHGVRAGKEGGAGATVD